MSAMTWDTSAKTVHRYEVPVDDQWHVIDGVKTPILHVAARHPGTVEFWAEHNSIDDGIQIELKVFGTGHLIPIDAAYFGTALAPYGLVWHLYGYFIVPAQEGESSAA